MMHTGGYDVCRICYERDDHKKAVSPYGNPCEACKVYKITGIHLYRIEAEVKELRYDVQKILIILKDLVEHIKYQPGGEEYHKAKSHFEEASKDSLAL
jgi:hypothetical protein